MMLNTLENQLSEARLEVARLERLVKDEKKIMISNVSVKDGKGLDTLIFSTDTHMVHVSKVKNYHGERTISLMKNNKKVKVLFSNSRMYDSDIKLYVAKLGTL
jgi:hypothetical protein